MHLPYVDVSHSTVFGVQVYGAAVMAAVAAAVLVTLRAGLRSGLTAADLALLVPCGIAAGVVCAHAFDVLVYRWDDAQERPELWLHLWEGVSLVGLWLGLGIATVVVVLARRLDPFVVADVVAIGLFTAIVIGRVGCALVHDHPGVPTDSVFGIEYPPGRLAWAGLGDGPVRAHDLGLLELLALLPIAVAARVLVWRRPNAGTVAAVLALGYAGVRFGLDFLRLSATEPTFRGLTAGQWGCLVVAALAGVGFLLIDVRGRRSALPTAIVR